MARSFREGSVTSLKVKKHLDILENILLLIYKITIINYYNINLFYFYLDDQGKDVSENGNKDDEEED